MADTIATDLRAARALAGRTIATNARIPLPADKALEIQMRWPEPTRNQEDRLNQTFLFSDPNVEDDEAANRRWKCDRILGRGGFGVAGLWKKYDENNIELDVCVVKQFACEKRFEYTSLPGVASEAVYQYQLNNLHHGNNTVHARRYKNYTNEIQQHRLYLEFCPHLDLDILIRRYRAWDQWLPELFVWHTFVALARVAVMMETGGNPWKQITNIGEQPADPGSFLLHYDLKPCNIFLGDAPPQDTTPDDIDFMYPQVKVGDFGLADLTYADSRRNPRFGIGTIGYMPPEARVFSAEWSRPLNGQQYVRDSGRQTYEQCRRAVVRSNDAKGIRFTSAHNVWAIGKTMHDLAFLKYRHEYQERFDEEMSGLDWEDQEDLYQLQEGLGFVIPPDTQTYDNNLDTLVNDCLHLDAKDRPSAATLLVRAEAGLAQCRANIIDPQDPNLRLFFRANEINDMPLGNAGLPDPNEVEYDQLMAHKYLDMAWETLRPPYARWGDLMDADVDEAQDAQIWPAGQGPFQIVDGGVVFTPDYAYWRPGVGAQQAVEQESSQSNLQAEDPALPEGPALPQDPVPQQGPVLPQRPAQPVVVLSPCRHRCKDKQTCGHVICCRR